MAQVLELIAVRSRDLLFSTRVVRTLEHITSGKIEEAVKPHRAKLATSSM